MGVNWEKDSEKYCIDLIQTEKEGAEFEDNFESEDFKDGYISGLAQAIELIEGYING